jgi:hypothetical protein
VVWKAHLLNMSSGLASDDVRSGLTYFSPFESFLYDYTISIVLDKRIRSYEPCGSTSDSPLII